MDPCFLVFLLKFEISLLLGNWFIFLLIHIFVYLSQLHSANSCWNQTANNQQQLQEISCEPSRSLLTYNNIHVPYLLHTG